MTGFTRPELRGRGLSVGSRRRCDISQYVSACLPARPPACLPAVSVRSDQGTYVQKVEAYGDALQVA